MKVLITGVSGVIGRMVADRLAHAGHEVLGIDDRPWPDAPRGVKMTEADLRKRPAEDVFRTNKPEAVVHMGTVTQFNIVDRDERDRINLDGTRRVFEYADRYGVQHMIFVGRHTYYGAAPDAPLYHKEHEPPISLSTFPELSDLVAADLYAGSALWRYPEMTTTVLRLCYTLGPHPPRHPGFLPQGAARAHGGGIRSPLPVHARAGRGQCHRAGPSRRRSRGSTTSRARPPSPSPW